MLGTLVLVGHDALLVGLHADGLKSHAVRVGAAADGHQQLIE
jgi:hypothetical protein